MKNAQSRKFTYDAQNKQIKVERLITSGNPINILGAYFYDGDGRADYAIYDSTTANWHIRNSASGVVQTTQWGTANDKAAQNDYDGDGKIDLTTWTDNGGMWHIKNSSNGSIRNQQWGQAGDIPVPAFYRR